jgi:hypothetical protein
MCNSMSCPHRLSRGSDQNGQVIYGYLDSSGQSLVDTEPDSPPFELLPSGNSLMFWQWGIFQENAAAHNATEGLLS